MANQIISDLFEKALETGQAVGQQLGQITPGQVAKTAVQQVTGSGSTNKSKGSEGNKPGLDPQDQKEIIKNLYGAEKPVDPNTVASLQTKDKQNQEQGIINARRKLQTMTRRYQSTQNEVLQAEHQREQEIPESEAGAPGGTRTWEEKQELIAKQQKLQAQQANEVVKPPSSGKNMPGIQSVIKQQQGSKELKLGKVG